MPESDKILIAQARSMSWEEILSLKAKSKEAQMQLDSIVRSKYHWSEYRCGML